MSKIRAILTFLFISTLSVFGQVTTKKDSSKTQLVERPYIAKVDIGSTLLMNDNIMMEDSKRFSLAVAFEYLYKKRSSFQLTLLSYNCHWNTFYVPMDNYSIGNFFGVIAAPEYKFYVSRKKRHSGYFISGIVLYAFEHDKDEFHIAGRWGSSQNGPYQWQYYPPYVVHEVSNMHTIGMGFNNGIQFYIKKRVALEAVAGLGFVESFYSDGGHQWDILPRLSACIGYRFGIKQRPDPFPDIPWD